MIMMMIIMKIRTMIKWKRKLEIKIVIFQIKNTESTKNITKILNNIYIIIIIIIIIIITY